MRTIFSFAWIMLAGLVLAGCATKIELQAQRTPNLDTSGLQRIAIMPFEASNYGYQSAAQYATTVATDKIRATNHFTLVSPSAINDAKQKGEDIGNYVEALFVGKIIRIAHDTTSQQGSYKDKDGNTISYIDYKREVELELTYSFERARDGTIIGPITKKGKTSSTSRNDSSGLASVESLTNKVIDSQLRLLYQDVIPHTVNIRRSLEKERNKELKPQMDSARAQVKSGNYLAARLAYFAIWQGHQSVPAAVNVSILYEAMGETQAAANFMQQVLNATGNPLARDTLARLNKELAEQAGVQQYGEAQNQVNKAGSHAISEVMKVLPANARLWIHNNETANQNLVHSIIDDMTATFLRNGITVIERQGIDLIVREQNFQISGSVSDDDFVSIGNLAGANTVLVIGIAGTGAGRRLQVRMLDIEKGTVIMQSDTSSDWHL